MDAMLTPSFAAAATADLCVALVQQAVHRVCFAAACLPVCHDSGVEAVQRVLDHRHADSLENLHLAASLADDGIKGVALQGERS